MLNRAYIWDTDDLERQNYIQSYNLFHNMFMSLYILDPEFTVINFLDVHSVKFLTHIDLFVNVGTYDALLRERRCQDWFPDVDQVSLLLKELIFNMYLTDPLKILNFVVLSGNINKWFGFVDCDICFISIYWQSSYVSVYSYLSAVAYVPRL